MACFYSARTLQWLLASSTHYHHTHTNSLFPGPLLSPFVSSSCILPSAGIPGIWIPQPAQSLCICSSLSLSWPFPQNENKPAHVQASIYSSRFPLLCNLSQARFLATTITKDVFSALSNPWQPQLLPLALWPLGDLECSVIFSLIYVLFTISPIITTILSTSVTSGCCNWPKSRHFCQHSERCPVPCSCPMRILPQYIHGYLDREMWHHQ